MALASSHTQQSASVGYETNDLYLRLIDPSVDSEIVAKISALLTESTEDFKESRGGHVPDVLVDEVIHKVYTSKESILTTFANTAYRFILTSRTCNELFGTILIAKSSEIILVKNSKSLNVLRASDNRDIAPPNYHSVINFATPKGYRLNGFAKAIIQEIRLNPIIRNLFAGNGLWIRGESPLHDALVKLGFKHRTEYDQFCHNGAQLPKDVPSVWDFNKKYLCDCRRSEDQKELFTNQKYKYGVFTLDF